MVIGKWSKPEFNLSVGISFKATYASLLKTHPLHMMASSNGNIFRVIGLLCGEFTSHRWIPHTKGQWRGTLMFSLICAWINGWVNNREAGDSRRHRAYYDVIVMNWHVVIPSLMIKWPDGYRNVKLNIIWFYCKENFIGVYHWNRPFKQQNTVSYTR